MPEKIAIFIHAAILSRCEERVNSYIQQMEESGLLKEAHTIRVCYLGPGSIPPIAIQDSRIQQLHLSDDLSLFEIPTQHAMWEYAKENPDAKILYLHTKGVGKEINYCIEDWVNYMTYFLVNHWRTCIEALQMHQTTGVDLRAEPTLHYSGNFWWVNASYLATLPDPFDFRDIKKYPNPLGSDRHNQEFWICYIKEKPIHITLWDSGINVYNRHVNRYPPHLYKI